MLTLPTTPIRSHRRAVRGGDPRSASRFTPGRAGPGGHGVSRRANEVKDGKLICGYLTAVDLTSGETWSSHPSVVGAADSPAFVKDAFLDYIDDTRARPLQLQTQYNCWFDYGKAVDTEKFVASVRKLNKELGDGPRSSSASGLRTRRWLAGHGQGLDEGPGVAGQREIRSRLQKCARRIAQDQIRSGIVVSPGCVFGGQPAIPKMREAGWRHARSVDVVDRNPLYGRSRETDGRACCERYWLLQARRRLRSSEHAANFDIAGFKGGEPELSDAKYDEAKECYLSLGSADCIKIFKRMGESNPDVYIVISNGGFLSSWWLQHVDAVWMINAGDAADGADRTAELVYRDGATSNSPPRPRTTPSFPSTPSSTTNRRRRRAVRPRMSSAAICS